MTINYETGKVTMWVVEGTLQYGVYKPRFHEFTSRDEAEEYCNNVDVASFSTKEKAWKHYNRCCEEIEFIEERNNRIYSY